MKRPSEFAPLAAHNSDYCLDASPDGETRCELCDQCAEVIEAAQADARAGMVPEADCIQPVYMMDEDGKEHEAPCECCERRGKPSSQHEAELAKAWEAGREEAAKLMDKRKGRWTTAYSETPDAAAIRALQPPGGKAK